MRRIRLLFSLVLAMVLGMISTAVVHADPAPVPVVVTIQAPDGVPAVVTFAGKAAAKGPEGTENSTTVEVSPGTHVVAAPDVVWQGLRYAAELNGQNVDVAEGSQVSVQYALAEGLQRFRPTKLDPNDVALTWEGSAAAIVRRVSGHRPAATANDGVAIPVSGNTAADTSAEPGVTYTYTVFDGAASMSLTLSVEDETSDVSQTFVLDYSARVLEDADLVSWAPADDGKLTVVLSASAPALLPGAGVMIQPGTKVPSGHAGRVAEIGLDGRTVVLSPGSLEEMFAYLDYQMGEPEDADAGDGGTSGDNDQPRKPVKPGLPATGLPLGKGTGFSCDKNESEEITIEPVEPQFTREYFKSSLDRYGFLGLQVRFNMDVDYRLKLGVKISAEFSESAECTIDALKKVTKNWMIGYVPVTLVFNPTVNVAATGEVTLKYGEFATEVGFRLKGAASTTDGISISEAKPILNPLPVTGTDIEFKASLGLEIGAELAFGLGHAYDEVGIYAGIAFGGEAIDASISSAASVNSGLCAAIEVKSALRLELKAAAWIMNWEKSASFKAFEHTVPWPGFPIDLPKGCSQEKPDSGEVTGTVAGPGVTVVEDELGGGPGQIGKVEGLVQGEATWVLSTGLVRDIVGVPGDFASTDLQRVGDARLSTLAGHITHDAVYYRAKLIPAGTNLHVRYAFASEEYPEYVGGVYNDVMAVYVDGKNCAFVPGTSDPVAVNTVNAGTNSQYFVDNLAGAAGYNTSMDGVTKPLTCTVPVTPGQQVEVVIAVADTSDGIYDSAVALLGKGIWSD